MQLTTLNLALTLGSMPLSHVAALSLPPTVPVERSLVPSSHYASIDITDGVPTEISWGNGTSSLNSRTNVRYCINNAAQSGVCVGIAGVLSQLGLGIATLLKSDSDNKDCGAHTGSMDNVQYKAYATGRNCDTTAEVKTIAGALDNYLRQQGKAVCDTHCLTLTHGGTWTAYLTIAPTGVSISNVSCGPQSSFGQCGSGGGGDNYN